VENGTSIMFKGVGATTLQLRRDTEILAWYVLVFTPVPPGKRCLTDVSDSDAVVDCAGKCVPLEEVRASLGNDTCDDGTPRQDGQPSIDLSCESFIPELLLNASLAPFDIVDQSGVSSFTSSDILALLNRPNPPHPGGPDAGDCSLDMSCIAQFGTAPGFELCSASASVCSFNATIGGTCADMCQQFGSQCVAALDNETPGCTSIPESSDTCQTPRQTEICICERR
jgi:hypothetical protein